MQHFRKISAILLSLLVLLSSTSFTFNMHFCMGQLKSIAVLSNAKACDLEVKSLSCARDKQIPQNITPKSCCQDQTLVVEGQNELEETASISIPDFQTVAVLYVVTSFLFEASGANTYSYKEYSPPLIDRDIPVLVQSFLI